MKTTYHRTITILLNVVSHSCVGKFQEPPAETIIEIPESRTNRATTIAVSIQPNTIDVPAIDKSIPSLSDQFTSVFPDEIPYIKRVAALGLAGGAIIALINLD